MGWSPHLLSALSCKSRRKQTLREETKEHTSILKLSVTDMHYGLGAGPTGCLKATYTMQLETTLLPFITLLFLEIWWAISA